MVAHYRQYNIMCSNLFLPFGPQRGLYKLLYDYNPLYINSNNRYYEHSPAPEAGIILSIKVYYIQYMGLIEGL
jgi:hypothetical protein